jgi:Ca-activated chloride channel family protein
VRVAIKGRVLERGNRPPLNLVFLIDTSGSMNAPNRLPLVQRGLELLAQQLDERDHLAIVTYAGDAGTALPAVAGSDQARIRQVIHGLGAAGSTNGAGGIEAAYAEALKHVAPGVQSRVVLCTDGDFNVGTTGDEELKRLIEAKRATGVFLSIYGFGMGNLKDQRLEMLANAGNGVYGYIDDEREARKAMVDDALGSLVTIAKDVKIQVFFNPTEVAGWRLIGFENRLLRRADFTDDRIDAGEIGAGHTVTALYEVVPAGGAVPAAAASDPNPFLAEPGERIAIAPGTLMQLRLRYKQPAGESSALIERTVAAAPGAMDDDFRFAAAVAGFGMLLRESPYKGACTWDLVQQLALAGAARDQRGLRAEFIGLIGRARTP